MPRLKYIGTKDGGERAFEAQTGIVWMPGSEHEVSPSNAALMLKHDDVWALVEEAPSDVPTTTLAAAKPKAKKA